MNQTELQALRRLLFFSIEEAARMIGAVSPRTWQYWETGRYKIPDDVAETVLRLAAWRQEALDSMLTALQEMAERHGDAAGVVLVWYATLDDWMTLPDREPELWRPHQSVIAQARAALGNVQLIAFDAPGYAVWLGRRSDSETMRGEWAAVMAD